MKPVFHRIKLSHRDRGARKETSPSASLASSARKNRNPQPDSESCESPLFHREKIITQRSRSTQRNSPPASLASSARKNCTPQPYSENRVRLLFLRAKSIAQRSQSTQRNILSASLASSARKNIYPTSLIPKISEIFFFNFSFTSIISNFLPSSFSKEVTDLSLIPQGTI